MMVPFKISDSVWCGPRPSTDEMHALSQQGVRSILSLERGYFELFHRQTNGEFIDAMNAGIIPLHIALGDVFAPSLEELYCAHAMAVEAQTWGTVYFHCRRGKDRTGMLRAICRVMDQDWSIEDAVSECLRLGGLAFPYTILGWEKRLREFLADAKEFECP